MIRVPSLARIPGVGDVIDRQTLVTKEEFDTEASARASADTALGARIDGIETLGHFVGTFDTAADLPEDKSSFTNGITVNDFVDVRADENHNGAITRYICSAIDADGSLTWTYDITITGAGGVDVSGKVDLCPPSAAGNLPSLTAAGQLQDTGVAAENILTKDATAAENRLPAYNTTGGLTPTKWSADSLSAIWYSIAAFTGNRGDTISINAHNITGRRGDGSTAEGNWNASIPNGHNIKFGDLVVDVQGNIAQIMGVTTGSTTMQAYYVYKNPAGVLPSSLPSKVWLLKFDGTTPTTVGQSLANVPSAGFNVQALSLPEGFRQTTRPSSTTLL